MFLGSDAPGSNEGKKENSPQRHRGTEKREVAECSVMSPDVWHAQRVFALGVCFIRFLKAQRAARL